jgi:hypothetical protein
MANANSFTPAGRARLAPDNGGKLQVSRPALLARLRRRLARNGERLCVLRGDHARFDVGDFYTVDTERACIIRKHVDPIALAKELGVLHDYEVVDWVLTADEVERRAGTSAARVRRIAKGED